MKKWMDTSEVTGGNIELYGNREVIVDGCLCIEDYRSDLIQLDFGEKRLRVKGEHLTVVSYAFGQVDVKGEIISLEFIS